MNDYQEPENSYVPQAEETSRRVSNFHIIYNSGEIDGGLNKGDAQKKLENTDPANIKAVIKGYEVPFKVEQKPMATIDG